MKEQCKQFYTGLDEVVYSVDKLELLPDHQNKLFLSILEPYKSSIKKDDIDKLLDSEALKESQK